MSEVLDGKDFARRFPVSRETLDRLRLYEELLRRWQKTINLVAPSTLDAVWHRHFADSAQLLALAPPEAKTWLDLGSGAGFPGLVLAIMLAERGGIAVTLVESVSRKAAFLGEVARQTGVAVDILCARIESPAIRDRLTRIDVITARALAPLPRLFELIAPLVEPNTLALLPKGRDVESEVVSARAEWQFDCKLMPSLTDPDGRIAVVSGLTANREGS